MMAVINFSAMLLSDRIASHPRRLAVRVRDVITSNLGFFLRHFATVAAVFSLAQRFCILTQFVKLHVSANYTPFSDWVICHMYNTDYIVRQRND